MRFKPYFFPPPAKVEEPKRGDTRTREHFLWFPLTALDHVDKIPYMEEVRWLEKAKYVERYDYHPSHDLFGSMHLQWKAVRFK